MISGNDSPAIFYGRSPGFGFYCTRGAVVSGRKPSGPRRSRSTSGQFRIRSTRLPSDPATYLRARPRSYAASRSTAGHTRARVLAALSRRLRMPPPGLITPLTPGTLYLLLSSPARNRKFVWYARRRSSRALLAQYRLPDMIYHDPSRVTPSRRRREPHRRASIDRVAFSMPLTISVSTGSKIQNLEWFKGQSNGPDRWRTFNFSLKRILFKKRNILLFCCTYCYTFI